MPEGTIKLNGYLYNLKSKVVGAYHSRLPGKVNTGSDSFDKEQFLSNWIKSDSRGGIGVDEMDERVHADRCWWTDCIVDYDGHTVLPRLATEISTFTAADSWVRPVTHSDVSSEWSNEANAYDGNTGTYATDTVAGYAESGVLEVHLRQAINCDKVRFWFNNLVGGAGSTQIIDVDLYYNAQWNDLFDGSANRGEWVTKTIGSTQSVSKARVQITNGEASGGDVTLNEFDFNHAGTEGTIASFVNFNSQQYLAKGIGLYKLDSDRGGYTRVKSFQGTITDLLIGPNGNLMIYLGDTDEYWYMTTAEAFTETNVNDATRGLLWDSKAWKQDADGNWWYSTNGDNSATPTWTSQTGIADIASQIERLYVGRDGDGDPAIYCSTNTWLKIFDFTNNAWINTEVKLYGNQHHGKGFVYWNAAHYLPYGLGVKQYTAGSTGTLSDVGLNRDGGLPAEYNGIIVALSDGGDQLFALVDASLTSGNSQSGLYAFTGRSWRCWWADSSNNGAMHDVIVTARSGDYAVYWDCGGSVYYTDVPQGLSNPKYLTGTQTYAASGIYLSPWFDGDNQAFQKLSKAIVTYAKGITTNETVVIKYRLNKTNTDRDTGWTTLDTLNTTGDNGEVINQIASGAGSSFNSFQFRLDFARGGTNTLSPDILALALAYRLITQGNWSWTMTLAIDDSHNTTPKDKWSNLESAIESQTDVAFIYRHADDVDATLVTANTHYVQFLNPREIMMAGADFNGEVNVQLLESWLP